MLTNREWKSINPRGRSGVETRRDLQRLDTGLKYGISTLNTNITTIDDSVTDIINGDVPATFKWSRYTGAGAIADGDDAYLDSQPTSEQITGLMRRINALEAGVPGTPTYNRKWGSAGSGPGQFSGAGYMCTNGTNVYVSDINNDRVQVFDTNGNFQFSWGSAGSGNGQFEGPVGICFFNNEIYVVDVTNARVQVFDTNGNFRRKWGSSGSGNGQFISPEDIVGYNSEIYVVDESNNRVQVFDTNGNFRRKWSVGTQPIGIDEFGGYLYVSELFNNRIRVYSTSGVFQLQVGSINSPHDLDVYNNNVYAPSNNDNVVKIYTVSGVFLQQFGSYGTGNGQFISPRGVLIYGGEIYVSEFGGNRIQVFSGVGIPQTPFFSYRDATPTSLGTPDGGVSVPSLTALTDNLANNQDEHITDMRTAIEALAPHFTNPATSNPYNWTNGSADNLYFCAVGTSRYNWARTTLSGQLGCSIDIAEIDLCLTELEAA